MAEPDGEEPLPSNGGEEIAGEIEEITPEIIEQLGPETVKKMVSFAMSEQFSGPLPPPRILAQYKDILPDAPERIFSMAERQGDHRIHLERTVVEQSERRANWGLALGFVLFLILAVGSLYLIAIGMQVSGLLVFVVAVASAVGNLISVLRTRNSQLEERSGDSKSPD